jgi:hypothetical protein
MVYVNSTQWYVISARSTPYFSLLHALTIAEHLYPVKCHILLALDLSLLLCATMIA